MKWRPARTWDAVVAFFFIEHVPDRFVGDLAAAMASVIRPGGVLFFAEGLARDSAADEVEVRELHGRTYQVVERRRPPDELTQLLSRAGFRVDLGTAGKRFVFGRGVRRL